MSKLKQSPPPHGRHLRAWGGVVRGICLSDYRNRTRGGDVGVAVRRFDNGSRRLCQRAGMGQVRKVEHPLAKRGLVRPLQRFSVSHNK